SSSTERSEEWRVCLEGDFLRLHQSRSWNLELGPCGSGLARIPLIAGLHCRRLGLEPDLLRTGEYSLRRQRSFVYLLGSSLV
ncbi:MAG TPA: hypothetical protein PKM59_16040, partial [Thermodesulfobacteriota bacterium]|nr:hypothetical protein [Thermodesulfobacteriota bacterium]